MVFGLFNATVKREDISCLKFNNEVRPAEQMWFAAKSKKAVDTDAVLQFVVKE